MGCVSSKADINDRHPNIFQVTNVNDQLRPISTGKLQVTETELVFYQRRKMPTKWPLRSLRKYGFDTEVFSFECGRRCPTGQGIYAFQCKKAELLFNIVHQHITGNVTDENNLSNHSELQIARRPNLSQTEGYLNPVSVTNNTRPHNSVSRPGSVSSNGPLSPIAISPPPDVPIEHNNNKRSSLIPEPNYTNTSVTENGSVLPHYANIVLPESTNETSHVYMNVDTNSCTKELTKDKGEVPGQIDNEERHCYANINCKDIENLRPLADTHSSSVPPTPTIPYSDSEYNLNYITVREVNYAELDLDPAENSPTVPPEVATAESPTVEKKGYATIDFQKTTALSQSINPRMTVEEGSRKTRHNSTINYNNSLSD